MLDDDPTGSQTVHDVSVVTVFEDAEYAAGLAEPGSTCFVLTNTRSLPEDAAVELNTRVAGSLFTLGQTLGAPVEVISRSDSTLRGHVLAEMQAIDAARRRVTGTGFDGVLLVPAYFEAGRFTAGDIHWANVDGEPVPVGDSEFAKDATFGYTSSNLREFVAEKSNGTIAADQVHSISLTDIREGGPDRVADILAAVTGGAFVVVNATDYADLEIVVLGGLQAQEQGKSFVYRCGPSFPRALAGLEPQGPLTAAQIWPTGRPGGHGLVVVGSHVGLTSRQVAAAQQRGGLAEVRTARPHPAGPRPPRRPRRRHRAAGHRGARHLRRASVHQPHPDARRRRRRQPGHLPHRPPPLVEVVQAALAAHPAWVVAKGGITSHDVAVRGLGIRRAEVIGQLFPGMVSVFRPIEAAPEAVGTPYVVFAGNVGDDDTLADVVDLFAGRR